ncbi:hypothetical protein J6590_056268 [Homalodisca vitripennis]|nr:hypothetical protein J6590_056268 [Homalodisca vitripennis]
MARGSFPYTFTVRSRQVRADIALVAAPPTPLLLEEVTGSLMAELYKFKVMMRQKGLHFLTKLMKVVAEIKKI